MGDATTIMLNLVIDDATHSLPELNRRLRTARIRVVRDLTEAWWNVEQRGWRWGGTKHPEVDVFGAAYAQLNLQRFMKIVLGTPWQYPDDVQLLVYRKEAAKFAVYEIVHGEWCELRRPRGPHQEAVQSVPATSETRGEGESP